MRAPGGAALLVPVVMRGDPDSADERVGPLLAVSAVVAAMGLCGPTARPAGLAADQPARPAPAVASAAAPRAAAPRVTLALSVAALAALALPALGMDLQPSGPETCRHGRWW